ncbi:DNA repair protein RadA [Jonesia quinghaiensis]|uniref:DNA repair protein RadA n=1 Tax=Jonesia quinghaiensis TaxID=262806 RepID=UPI00048C0338|nr:DNA repair protein RadA [Jonesia quinghaiensis]
MPAAPKKARTSYTCSACGWSTPKWVGRCTQCGEWGTLTEASVTSGPRTAASTVTTSATLISDVDSHIAQARATGISEFDRVLGGGLVPGAVVLLAGEPGVGKSTLLLDVAATAARSGQRVLYVTAEESAGQVRLRAERIGALSDGLYLAAEVDLGQVLGHVDAIKPDLFILDSVQTIASTEVEGAAGGVAQVKEVASAVISVAKKRNIPTILVGHVTKDGSVAGPRTLEHLVDVVCQFEGDRHSRLRMVRAVKNRYGPTDEVGCFDLGEAGIVGLADPSGLFLSQVNMLVPGTCITVTLEGRRPLALEVQSLVVPSSLNNPRRTTSGVDSSRLAMILAVAHRHLGARLMDADIYVSTVGGARITEPAVDLAMLLAVMSAVEDKAFPVGTIALGEVGLAGELRSVQGLARRLSEAARLGFTRAVVPANSQLNPIAGLEILPARTVQEALERAHS